MEKKNHKYISGKKRIYILNKFNNKCAYCGKDLEIATLLTDHIDNYGTNEIDNLNPCCKRCNTVKGKKSLEEFRITFSRISHGIPSFSEEQRLFLIDNFKIDPYDKIFDYPKSFYFEEWHNLQQ